MVNPIMAAMSQSNSNVFSQLMGLKNMMQGKNPDAVYQMMMNSNPQFARFVSENRGKSPEEIARAHGIDLEQVKQMMR